MQRVRRGCCERVVLFLWKRDGWGKAVVGTGHPCPCRSNAPSKMDRQPCLHLLIQRTAHADEINACILDKILLHPQSITVLGCVPVGPDRQPCGC